MREILFRGKRVDNNEWVEGDLIHSLGRTYCGIYAETLGQVDPATIGQYTGLKDKNGKRIFEGDIVQVWWEGQEEKEDAEPAKYKAVVEFGNPNCEYDWGYQLRFIDYIPFNKSILLWVDCEESGAYCEVIGNIHNNPEPMKG